MIYPHLASFDLQLVTQLHHEHENATSGCQAYCRHVQQACTAGEFKHWLRDFSQYLNHIFSKIPNVLKPLLLYLGVYMPNPADCFPT